MSLGSPTPRDYDRLLSFASEISGIPMTSFLEKGRGSTRLSRWRMAIFYILRNQGATFQEIGSYFNRDYSTVIYGCKVLDSKASDAKVRDTISKLSNHYQNHGDTNIK